MGIADSGDCRRRNNVDFYFKNEKIDRKNAQ